ncbi:MAG: PrsW family intramembrane metalloprotease [Chloroflexi bacterium]|nr:PrsW family intramembrane metalloprotease [Chloroflexota bacterium]
MPQAPTKTSARHHLLAFALAMAGGVLGIIGAGVGEFRSGGFLLLPFVGGPIIEEVAKPVGVYALLARWPHVLRSQLFSAVLAAAGGLSFGLIEAVADVTVYVSEPPDWFVVYRFTAPLALHVVASFIVGLGLNQGLLDWARGRGHLPKASRNLYIAAIALHAAFNIAATALAIAGYLDVD